MISNSDLKNTSYSTLNLRNGTVQKQNYSGLLCDLSNYCVISNDLEWSVKVMAFLNVK